MSGKISFERTPGGVPVLVESVPGCGSAGYMVGVRTGSRDERDGIDGISHLLEHVVFRETENRSSYQMAKDMEGAGGEMNAFTGKEMTAFYAVTIKETKGVARDAVAEVVAGPLIKEGDVELEKKIVVQELSMIENEPETYIHDVFSANIWRGHPLSRDEGGTQEIVKGLTAADLRGYYGERYGIPNIAVFAAGAVEPDEVLSWAEDRFDGLSGKKETKRERPAPPKAGHSFRKNRSEHYHVAMGFPSYGADHRDKAPLALLSAALGSGISSRLFQEVREERALVYAVYNMMEQHSDAGAMYTCMSCTSENVADALEAVARVYREMRDEGLREGELERTKNLVKGSLVRSMESTERRMYVLGRDFLLSGRPRTLADRLDALSAVTEEDVMRVAADVIKGSALNVSVLGRKDKAIEALISSGPDV
ncbi:MAG: insulinase family protein [Methanomassiliicoccaceae archaeon]|nr:insulinase family protein [Methanomassiliicoccaceae archaeon]